MKSRGGGRYEGREWLRGEIMVEKEKNLQKGER